MKRTHGCGQLTTDDVGMQVCLQGWVWHRRDLGGLIFIDLRDRTGAIQCLFDPSGAAGAHSAAHDWRVEFVVEVVGRVERRDPENVNPRQPTGEIEVRVEGAVTLAESDTPPFLIEEDAKASEEMRLRHRVLDLRRPPLQRSLRLRHELALAARNQLGSDGFLEIETPMLTRSTPEGARDYLVPSRVHPGHFYALPQSPQLFKQLLMVAGMDRYFQIVRCFRDEDLRADRQPEFTQIDLEMSFVEAADVRAVTEKLMRRLLAVSGLDDQVDFPHLSFHEALDRYGSDRPDLRHGHELCDLTGSFEGAGFRAFAEVVAAGGSVKGLRLPGGAAWGRSRFDKLTEQAKKAGAKGLVWIKRTDEGYQSPVAKFLGDELLGTIAEQADVVPGDALLLVGDEWEIAATTLGTLRSSLARSEGWIEEGLRFAWVNEFPLLERSPDGSRLTARHHPFTAPLPEDRGRLADDPLSVRAQSYDLVLNGVELGGGSIRIHERALQEEVFAALGISPEEAAERFGFLLRGLRFGAPPHGGIALGFDRIVMLMSGVQSLRDTIAFPKTTSATDLLTEAPGRVDEDQLRERSIAVRTAVEPGSSDDDE